MMGRLINNAFAFAEKNPICTGKGTVTLELKAHARHRVARWVSLKALARTRWR